MKMGQMKSLALSAVSATRLRLQADLLWGRILIASGLLNEALSQLKAVYDRADKAGLAVIAHTALALQAEAMWESGQRRDATTSFRTAVKRLQQTGDVPALVEACTAQARAMVTRPAVGCVV